MVNDVKANVPGPLAIGAVENAGPPHSLVAARQPDLANGAVLVRRPGDLLELPRAVRQPSLTFHHHFAVHDAAGDQEHRAGIVDPRLVPLVVTGVPRIEAVTSRGTSTGPRFVEHAAAKDPLDAVVAGLLAHGRRSPPSRQSRNRTAGVQALSTGPPAAAPGRRVAVATRRINASRMGTFRDSGRVVDWRHGAAEATDVPRFARWE